MGSRPFAECVQAALGGRARYRHLDDAPGVSVLRESEAPYEAHSRAEMVRLNAPDGCDFNQSSAQRGGCGGETALGSLGRDSPLRAARQPTPGRQAGPLSAVANTSPRGRGRSVRPRRPNRPSRWLGCRAQALPRMRWGTGYASLRCWHPGEAPRHGGSDQAARGCRPQPVCRSRTIATTRLQNAEKLLRRILCNFSLHHRATSRLYLARRYVGSGTIATPRGVGRMASRDVAAAEKGRGPASSGRTVST